MPLGMQSTFADLGLIYLPSICSPSRRALAKCHGPGPLQSSQRLLTTQEGHRHTLRADCPSGSWGACSGGLLLGTAETGVCSPSPIVGSGYNLLLTLQSCARPFPGQGRVRPGYGPCTDLAVHFTFRLLVLTDFSLLCYMLAPPIPSDVFKQTAAHQGWTGLPTETHAQCPWEPGGCLFVVWLVPFFFFFF